MHAVTSFIKTYEHVYLSRQKCTSKNKKYLSINIVTHTLVMHMNKCAHYYMIVKKAQCLHSDSF